jgi:dTDP-4-amino-4,6-dideoxygalactose transaminase
MKNLAINGGLPVRTKPFPPWPFFDNDEIEAVNGVLISGNVNYWTGDQCGLFEKEFAAFIGVNYAVSVMNGTAALESTLTALNIGSGDEVIVTPRGYIASASCAVRRGAKPVFADVDRDSQNINADTIEEVITEKTRAVVVVHLAGCPCEMDGIVALAKKRGLALIEDCAQASGAFYKGRPVGSFSDAAAFSFCQDKIITSGGEGGMVVTNNKDIWSKVWSYKDHGKSLEAVYNNDLQPGPFFKWLHESFGTNLRMTEMQAAIGRVQLRKMAGWVEIRRRNAAILEKAFLRIPALCVTVPPDHIYHSYYKYYVFVEHGKLKSGWNRERVIAAINAEGIPCFTGSCGEIYMEKAFNAPGMRPEKRLPVAEELSETAMMFLVHPTLSENDMRDMVQAVEKVMAFAVK